MIKDVTYGSWVKIKLWSNLIYILGRSQFAYQTNVLFADLGPTMRDTVCVAAFCQFILVVFLDSTCEQMVRIDT